jgi:hypothetical protein
MGLLLGIVHSRARGPFPFPLRRESLSKEVKGRRRCESVAVRFGRGRMEEEEEKLEMILQGAYYTRDLS